MPSLSPTNKRLPQSFSSFSYEKDRALLRKKYVSLLRRLRGRIRGWKLVVVIALILLLLNSILSRQKETKLNEAHAHLNDIHRVNGSAFVRGQLRRDDSPGLTVNNARTEMQKPNSYLKRPQKDESVLKDSVEAALDIQTINGVENVMVSRLSIAPGVDEEHLHGRVGLNPDQSPVWKSLPPLPLTNETVEEKKLHHRGHQFNKRRSDGLPLDRPLADVRHQKCTEMEKSFPENLPSTSVVFVFYNEPLSTTFRSIHSVLNRTPPKLLKEIILVDDGSDAEWLKSDLEEYVAVLPKTKLVRLPERDGLMLARQRGAEIATGETITFLDAHIEVTVGWLEPLMARIAEDRKHVVMPIIDSIHADTFVYKRGGIDILGFSWMLGQNFIGSERPRSEFEPMESPIMAGGLFSIDRQRFFELGAYDPGQKLYGGEEMEFSFRLWQCGSTLECIPCSRVGHIFRSKQYWEGSPFSKPGDVVTRNKLRAAEVWMDEYKGIVQRAMPKLPEDQGLGDLSHLLEVKERLQCKPFSWYLENVFPELFVPNNETVNMQGAIRNFGTKLCFDTMGKKLPGSTLGVFTCHNQHGPQDFVYTRQNEIRVTLAGYATCLDTGGDEGGLIQYSCHGKKGPQLFEYDEATKQIFQHMTNGKRCITVSPPESGKYKLTMEECEVDEPGQKWFFEDV